MQNAIIYTRVSTDEQADKGYSLRDQKDRLEKYCSIQGINIIAHYQDDHSAKSFDRPQFKKLEEFLKVNKHQVDLLLVVKWDRFSRNSTESLMMIRKFTKLGIKIDAVEQPIDLSIPENKLMLSFYLTAPEVENDRRALNTSSGMRRAKKEGRFVSTPPFGYKFGRDAINKPILIHNEKAPLVKESFELYATGLYSKEEIRKKLRFKGMTLQKNAFWKMLKNPIYCGLIHIPAEGNEPEEFVKGIHEPIISDDLFEQVQYVDSGKKKVKAKAKKVVETFPMRGFLICNSCGTNLTASISKGNGGSYMYYHCQPGCKERHKAELVHDDFGSWLDKLTIKPEIAQLYLAVMEDIFKTQEGDRNKEIKAIEKEIEKNKLTLAKSAEKLVNDELDKWGYQTLKESLSNRNTLLRGKLNELKEVDSGFNKYLSYGISLLGNLKHYYTSANVEGKQKFLGLIFPEKLIYQNGNYRTNYPNELIELLCIKKGDFLGYKQEKAGDESNLSFRVARRGIEPLFPE